MFFCISVSLSGACASAGLRVAWGGLSNPCSFFVRSSSSECRWAGNVAQLAWSHFLGSMDSTSPQDVAVPYVTDGRHAPDALFVCAGIVSAARVRQLR